MIKPTTFLLVMLPLLVWGQKTSGISFRKDSWSQLLTRAKAEKKLIFLDAYADWCKPCNLMASDVFTNSSVGTFFNANFINAKIDMEKGEGVKLSEKFEVTPYPTFLFIDGNGKLLHRSVGYKEADEFITTGKNALNPETQYYTLRDKFDKSSITEVQLYTLATQAVEISDEKSSYIVSAYLDKQKNWLTENSIRLILAGITDPESNYFTFLNKNENAAGQIIGEKEIRDGLDGIVLSALANTLSDEDPIEIIVQEVENGVKKYRPTQNAQRLSYQVGAYLAERAENRELLLAYRSKLVTQFEEELSWGTLYEYAMDFFENETEMKNITIGLDWALKSIKKDSNYYNNDVAARLHYKLGNKKEARQFAETALTLGNTAGTDVSETEKLLTLLQ